MDELQTNTPSQAETTSGVPAWAQWIIWLVVLGLLIVVGLQMLNNSRTTVQPGVTAPDFTFNSYDGTVMTSDEMRGKIVLINIWASWCKPCEQEADELQAAWEQYADRGDVLFLGVAYADTDAPAMRYLERFGITYPNGPDLGTQIYDDFHATGVPETYVIDRDGMLTNVKVGPFDSQREITNIIDSLLAE
jgi:cytochrome c biogenesis protein CcmG/thiol:disulfide interchange protein DsbE